jgi:hypothetical protein
MIPHDRGRDPIRSAQIADRVRISVGLRNHRQRLAAVKLPGHSAIETVGHDAMERPRCQDLKGGVKRCRVDSGNPIEGRLLGRASVHIPVPHGAPGYGGVTGVRIDTEPIAVGESRSTTLEHKYMSSVADTRPAGTEVVIKVRLSVGRIIGRRAGERESH